MLEMLIENPKKIFNASVWITPPVFITAKGIGPFVAFFEKYLPTFGTPMPRLVVA